MLHVGARFVNHAFRKEVVKNTFINVRKIEFLPLSYIDFRI